MAYRCKKALFVCFLTAKFSCTLLRKLLRMAILLRHVSNACVRSRFPLRTRITILIVGIALACVWSCVQVLQQKKQLQLHSQLQLDSEKQQSEHDSSPQVQRFGYSPNVPEHWCYEFNSSAAVFKNLKTNHTNFYPNHKRVFKLQYQNKRVCGTSSNIRLFLGIVTRPQDFETRAAIRRTFASQFACRDALLLFTNLTCKQLWSQTRYAFFAGVNETDTLVNERLKNESLVFQDVVRLTVIERHDEMTLKTMALFHWVTLFCSQTQFVAKLNDSVFNLANIFLALDQYNELRHDHFIAGYVNHNAMVSRDEKSRYYFPSSVFPQNTLPDYVFGCGYFLPYRTAQLLYQAGRCVALTSIEDIYITGLLRASLNISLVMQPCVNCFGLNVTEAVKAFYELDILNHVSAESMYSIWTVAGQWKRPSKQPFATRIFQLNDARQNSTRCKWLK